ncbi:DUF885 domain-containing protein [Pseudoalteromonas shioyasakiensis]|uniref:DUF885 domain-containing protein n=1 Tax=Pseudoalteromonas shioyasakiensis TaxID=1190813 RepID=A0ABT6U1Q7_9GAMM|nr:MULTISPECIES: DUF885 domain-containing protein [Pseudoalteromonas]MDI4670083.1 DUF885 domain-containing protein [Pseudoalteromonas shioyasakiensis]MDI4674999.1 DUF885 domain-containing protein [Pseudoalteromonas shioyasakiensis]MDI4686968.1 DUF885 domain-containing protein [Pseudoalteromonas shioyasakiensis]MDI4705563.1 DUF885 domain-containing protein [Pseudoalteromonas shioyasakiensis]NRA77960.1 DUF885 domain-containing protein [Pseudoalteromonas sp.]
MKQTLSRTLNRSVIAVALACTLSACQVTNIDADQQFTQVAENIVNYRQSISPYGKENGVDGYLLENLSAEFLEQKYKKNTELLAELDAIDRDKLSEENRINLTILRGQVQNSVDEYVFNAHYMPLTSEYGFHSSLSFMISSSDYTKPQDYQLYLAKLQQIPRYFSQNIGWMRKGLEVGLTQPKAVLEGYQDSITAYIVDDATQSEFYKPFLNNTAGVSDSEFAALQKQAQTIITEQVIPAYQGYLTFFNNEYQPGARTDIGISSTPNGKAFYENRAKYYTTTDMTPKEIHELGLQEVARIRAEMEKIIEKVGFEGSFADFVHFLRTDPQFYAKTPKDLLKEASYIAKKMDAQLPKLFHTLPRMPYGVAPVPESIAPKYTTGRYSGSRRDDQAGYYWVNTYALDKRPLYVLEALTLHEAVPGHHLQISLNAELESLPSYRRNAYLSAFGEGWGLYSEFLGIEAGFYQDPYSDFGRLTYEMWRAARLVVDTGMHMYGWSRERAMKFMSENTALSLHNVKTETDRYISWPAQALSYKIGELTIKRLRHEAEQALGQDFDIREFHHQILRHGSVPMSVLEEQIQLYIKAELAKRAA